MSIIHQLYNLAMGWLCFLPVSIPLLVLVITSAKTDSQRTVSQLGWLQFSIPLILILLGGLLKGPGTFGNPAKQWMIGFEYGLLIAQVPIGLFILWEVQRYRISIAVFSIIQVAISLAVIRSIDDPHDGFYM